MKVKEILEILGDASNEEELLQKLQNVEIEADLETDIKQDIIKKLEKLYKMPIKKKKATPVKAVQSPVEETVVVTPTVEAKPTETKIPQEKKVLQEKTKETKVEKPISSPKEKETQVEEVKAGETVEVELKHVYDKYEEFVKEEPVYTRLKNVKRTKAKSMKNRQANIPQEKQEKILYYYDGITVAKVADGLNVNIGEVVKKLISIGHMMGATAILERDTVEILALEFDYELQDQMETDITKFELIDFSDDPDQLQERPPIVTIMGHVDHGKTTLLDTIRNARVVASEAGGITQHIGAYQVNKDGKFITFIDTPGHAAFTEMRARGAEVTDIVVLIVAADDGVMPQTIEAIEHAQAAKVPIIVAINKMDKPNANPERIKQELAGHNLLAEEWGGKTIFVPVSALTGAGVEELLEMIILVADLEQYKANPNRLGYGSVIEAKLDRGRGVVATILVKNGTVKIGDPIVVGSTYGKIRAMQDEKQDNIKQAGPSKAVEITGLSEVPNAGDRFMVFEDEKTSRLVAEQRQIRSFDEAFGRRERRTLSSMFEDMDGETKELRLIIKGDVKGSIEALRGSLEKVTVEGVKIEIVRSAVGTITDTDISLALASDSIIIGFNIRPNAKILDDARQQGVEVRLYNVIYQVIDDIEKAMKGLLDPVFEEKVIGQAEVREIYKVSRLGTIAGCYVTNGEIRRNSKVRLIRQDIQIYEGALASLKRFQDDAKEVRAGFECGIMIENYNDIKVGDVIEAYVMEKVKNVL